MVHNRKISPCLSGCINICMKVTSNDIRANFNSYADQITHAAVGHTHFRPANRDQIQIDRMVEAARKQVHYFRRCFNQFLYSAKSHRKPELYTPLMLTTMEGANGNALQDRTIHFHFSLGNIPGALTTDELRQVFRHCWVEKAGLSERGLWLRDRHDHGIQGWNNYITKEAERGNMGTWDFENSQIPHAAFANGQRT